VPAIGGRSRSRLPAAAVADLGLRPAGDPYRTAFAAISLTAITKSSARAGRRQARPRRPPRHNPAHLPQVISAESQPARHGGNPPPPPNPPTPPPSPSAGRPRNKPSGFPCSQGCALKSLRLTSPPVRSSLTTPRISPALRPRRKGWAEVGMGVAAAGGGAASGPVMAGGRVRAVAAAGAVAAIVVLSLAWPGSTARTGR
jgi:hypothetical protein